MHNIQDHCLLTDMSQIIFTSLYSQRVPGYKFWLQVLFKQTLFCPGMQQQAKGYKEEGPPDIIQVELSKLSYIHSTGEVENSKLERQQKESTPNINKWTLIEPLYSYWNEWERNLFPYHQLLEHYNKHCKHLMFSLYFNELMNLPERLYK